MLQENSISRSDLKLLTTIESNQILYSSHVQEYRSFLSETSNHSSVLLHNTAFDHSYEREMKKIAAIKMEDFRDLVKHQPNISRLPTHAKWNNRRKI